jgi:cytochrome c oxidase assembly protein subunit 15
MVDSSPGASRFFYTAFCAVLFACTLVTVDAYTRIAAERAGCALGYNCVSGSAQTGAGLLKDAYQDRPWEQKVHPFLAAALALIVLRLAYLAWRSAPRTATRRLVVSVLVFILALAFGSRDLLGADVRAQPWAGMVQGLTALALLALLWWLLMREQRFWRSVADGSFTRSLRPYALLAVAVVSTQIGLGMWLTVNHSGLPCVDFPTCDGVWWPPMDMQNAFAFSRLWQPLAVANAIPAEVATAMHVIHRVVAMFTLFYVGWLAMHVFWRGIEAKLCRYGLLLALLLFAEMALGIITVVERLPMAVMLAHSIAGTLLLLAVLTLYHVARPAAERDRMTAPTQA